MTPCRASTLVWNFEDWREKTFHFKYYDLDTSFRVELDEIDADPLVDVGEHNHGAIRPSIAMRRIAIDYLRRNKVSKYIPQPSEQEEIIAEGTYDEYRRQAEEDMQPKHISHIIENAPEDSILGLIGSIKSDADAITRLDGPDSKEHEWPDEPDHDCYHMEEVH